jgi:uncharacterized radical SAM protein YgiQ
MALLKKKQLVNNKDMITTDPLPSKQESVDIILISGEFWADHPHSGIGVIARVLDAEGYSVGIIEKPDWNNTEDFLKFGMPKLFFGISAGAIDSMLANYTPLKKLRSNNEYNPYISGIPDRAIIVYSQKVRQAINAFFKKLGKKKVKIPIIIGGVEASLRRFTHYDYWDNKLRRSILFDAKADILVYGPGEYQIREIAKRIKSNGDFKDIEGICYISNEKITDFTEKKYQGKSYEILPSHESVLKDKIAFCKMQLQFSNGKNLIQEVGDKLLIQNMMYDYSQEDLDQLYELPFTYSIPSKYHEFEMLRFSIITHRGCFGNCNFCSIALHQGDKIVSRSIDNIITEIKKMSKQPEFKGYISDIGGPSANMYGMDCENHTNCSLTCLECPKYNNSHTKLIELLKKSRQVPSVKKTFVRSGIRYDLSVDFDEYLEELCEFHISGNLKIAPEHFSPNVEKLINKNNKRFDEFKAKFEKLNETHRNDLRYYFITAHPGSTMADAEMLRKKMKQLNINNLKRTEAVQIFTPTPMSISTCMYYTGLNPFTLEEIYIPYSYSEKKEQKRILF